jgi:FtsP/CotA-like multicopper oxidase with cupredoxin domain
MAGMHHLHGGGPRGAPGDGPCGSGAMTPVATNLHFHGMTLPPVCHQDEVLKTSIQPEDPPFEYRFTVPRDESPGLYWYHPHIHGFSSMQVTAGASGAIIVEGLEKMIPEVAGLPERVFVIRDPNLSNPDAPPSPTEPVVPKILLDPEGDVANNNTGYGKPARDLSINSVPVPYPDYPAARIRVRPGQRELWRVLNASAITYLNIGLKFDGAPQSLGIVAIDGSPVDQSDAQGAHVKIVDHLAVPPGSRAEFIVQTPTPGAHAMLFTRMVDTGPDGENDPNRNIAVVEAFADAPEPPPLPAAGPVPGPTLPWVGSVQPSRTRLLYFSEQHSDPADPRSPMKFYITEAGREPKVFDPASGPDIVVKQGEVEDWVVENRSRELHAFHIHQLHFQLRQWMKIDVDEPFLRDTVSIPYFDPESNDYPRVVVRIDFRGPDTVGVFPYHCHLLEHEDGGMMGTIRVEPAGAPAESPQQR